MGQNSQFQEREKEREPTASAQYQHHRLYYHHQVFNISLSLSLANVFKYAETTKELAGERCKRERVCVVFLSEQGLCFWASNRPTTYPTRDSLVACDEARG
jgi:hypothetical protein